MQSIVVSQSKDVTLSVNSPEFTPRMEAFSSETLPEVSSCPVEVLNTPLSENNASRPDYELEAGEVSAVLSASSESETTQSCNESVSKDMGKEKTTTSIYSEVNNLLETAVPTKDNLTENNVKSNVIDADSEINGHVTEPMTTFKDESDNDDVSSDESPVMSEKLKYNFHPEPYESVNALLERKMKYDRDFLLSLRTSDFAKSRPMNLPSDVPDIMLSSSPCSGTSGGSAPRDMLPSWLLHHASSSGYIKPAVTPRSSRDSGKRDPKYVGSSGRALDARSGYNKQTQKVIEVRRDKVELHKAEQAYKVTNMRYGIDRGLSEDAELERSIRSYLNKITPQNFETCFEQIMLLKLDTPSNLNILINVLFEKATLEESYAVTFAKLCKQLSFLKVDLSPSEEDTSNATPSKSFIGFRSLLLQKCQVTFEAKLVDLMENEAQKWDLKINAETDEKKKTQLEEYKAEKIKKEKDRYYGNIK